MSIRSLLRELISKINKQNFENVRFLDGCYIDSSCKFEGFNSVGENARLLNCTLGTGSYIGRNADVKSIKIGKFCSIGAYLKNTTGRHPVTNFVSTHPSFFSTQKAAGFTFSSEQLYEENVFAEFPYYAVIGNDVWIGNNVTIMDNVVIGDGAIIGANSLVTKNVEPYSINVGIPAKRLRYRFDSEDIDLLMSFKWWDKDMTWLSENAKSFADIEQFHKLVKEQSQ